MNNGYEHASQYQLFLCAYPHGKRVMPLACERVKTCRVRAFTLFPEIPWIYDSTYNFKCSVAKTRLTILYCRKKVVGTLETVRDREVSILERCLYREVRL